MTPDARFARCLPHILHFEGGWSNNPQDPGGATNQGITQRTLSAYLGRPASIAELRLMPAELVAAVYRKMEWAPVCGDELPDGVDMFVFDSAVNCGAARAARWLQHGLGVAEDGAIGPGTLRALESAHLSMLLEDMRQAREAHYRSLSSFSSFGHGWLSRLELVSTLALGWLEPAGRAAA